MQWLEQYGFYLAAAGIVILLAILGWRVAAAQREQRRAMNRLRQNGEQQAQAIQLIRQALSEFSERQDRLRDTLDGRMDALQSSNARQLEQMRETVSTKLDSRLSESFRTVNRQLADVHRGLGQMQELAGEFGDLKRVLGGVKTRGIWGEAQLRGLLEQTLAPNQYLENAAIPEGSQTRVEFAVRLPASDGEALLPIDSKFPQEDFLRLTDAAESGDPVRVEQCAAKLEKALTEQARMISEKYIRPPQTADFAIMFLPVESLYAEAVRRSGLCERLQTKYRVLVAGPNTLSALLVSLRMGFRTVTLERRGGEVLQLLGEVREEFARYADAAQVVRRRMDQTYEALDALDLRAKKLARRLKDISEEES